MQTISDIGENKLIEIFKQKYKLQNHTVIGIGDDAAVIKTSKDKLLLFTTDMIVEDVHFTRKEAKPYRIGWKAMGAALSDIAAMAGSPLSALVSIALPDNLKLAFVRRLMSGMEDIAAMFKVDINGGDTVRSLKGIYISISVIGEVEKGNFILRRGAKAGDRILVTGALGGSRKEKQYNFMPRVNEAKELIKITRINSMMDITDGLSMDLHRLITASNVGARLYEEKIPVSKDSKGVKGALEDGEDFELLFTASLGSVNKILKKWKNKNVPVSVIGEVTSKKRIMEIVDRNGRVRRMYPKGYEHFQKKVNRS